MLVILGIVADLEDRFRHLVLILVQMLELLRVLDHGPELQHPQALAVTTVALAGKEDRLGRAA